MKQITCSKCTQVWFVDEPNLQFITTCPYCAASIREKVKFSQPDSLDKAIYLAIEGLGNNALESPTRIGGYISDIAPNLKKELRVLSHTFREEYFSIVRSAFEHDIKTAEKEISKLIRLLIDEDGLSETWAKQIGSSYLDAIKLVNGIGLEEVLLADVAEYKGLPSREEFRSNTLPPEQFERRCTPEPNSPQTDIGAMRNNSMVGRQFRPGAGHEGVHLRGKAGQREEIPGPAGRASRQRIIKNAASHPNPGGRQFCIPCQSVHSGREFVL